MDGWPQPSPWARLGVAEANSILREGDYELWVERCRSGPRLTGEGIGNGLPLAGDFTWPDLCRALVRLRRTRQRHDAGWLDGLTRVLGGPGSAVDTAWIALDPGRVERVSTDDQLPERVQRCLNSLIDAEGAVLFPADALACPETRARASGSPTVADLTGESGDRAVRLQTTSTSARLDSECARYQMRQWSRLSSAVDSDPVLRMHCATQPIPAALVDVRTDSAMLARLVEPAPPHPGYPGGTLVAGLDDLLRPSSDGSPDLLRKVIENRFERREDELGYFLEHFVRPLLRTFRHALDAHDIGLCSLEGRGFGFELSSELQATGRVVITEYAGVCDRPARARDEVRAGIRALSNTVDALRAGFSGIPFHGGDDSVGRVGAAVDRVITEELRYLKACTAELLASEQQLQRFVHTVAASQDEALKEILRTVQSHTRSRRWNPGLPQPTVVIDLDLCGIVPWQRTLDAARAISGPRCGAPEGLFELARPGSLRALPTFAETTWHDFVQTNELDQKYPMVDWRAVYRDFFRAFARPSEQLRSDTVNAGLARFVWDVQDAGGKIVFCTGRRERLRELTRNVLTAGGVPDALLLCMPDDQTRPVSELKVEKLRELGDVDVVAVFDDMVANRIAITKEFPAARALAVEVPGLATERQPDQPTPDGAPVIATFETSPRPDRPQPTLSNTHSLEELQVGALRNNRLANRWAVHLSTEESMSIVDSVMADSDRAAARTGSGALAKFALDQDAGRDERTDRVMRAVHHVFTRKQFLKGSRSNYQFDDLRQDVERFVRQRQPIEVVLLGFPVKQCLNRLKASGPLPDLAELGALARLRELQRAVSVVYPPGLHFNILTDGRHFRPRPAAITDAYQKKLRQYVHLAGIESCTTVVEIDRLARHRIGPDLPAERAARFAHYRTLISETLAGFDIVDNPLRTVEAVHEFALSADPPMGHILALFREILMSVVYSVAVTFPPGVDRLAWSSRVYADVYNVTDSSVSQRVRQTRIGILRRAWDTVIRYLATLQVDEDLGYDGLIPDRVRLTVSAARPGRCGFSYLGGSGLLPWQGTGAIDPRGKVAVDFAVSMFDQGFVPVYSPLLGPRQPWFMTPGQQTGLDERSAVNGGPASRGVRLDSTFAARARLRRK